MTGREICRRCVPTGRRTSRCRARVDPARHLSPDGLRPRCVGRLRPGRRASRGGRRAWASPREPVPRGLPGRRPPVGPVDRVEMVGVIVGAVLGAWTAAASPGGSRRARASARAPAPLRLHRGATVGSRAGSLRGARARRALRRRRAGARRLGVPRDVHGRRVRHRVDRAEAWR